MSRKAVEGSVAAVIVYGSIGIAVGRFFWVEPELANRALWQGILLVSAGIVVAAGICNSEKIAKFTREGGWQYWLCFGVALLLGVTGTLDMRGTALRVVLFCSDQITHSDPTGWMAARGMAAGFPANLIYFLLTLVVVVICVVVGLGFLIGSLCLMPFVMLDLAAQQSRAAFFASHAFYALMLAFTFQWIVFPVVHWVAKHSWPTVAAVVNDVFIGIPQEAGEELERNGQTTVVQRKTWQLVIAIVAGLIAILAHFIRTG